MIKRIYVKRRGMDPILNTLRCLYVKILFGDRVRMGGGVKLSSGISLQIGPRGNITFHEGCIVGRNVDMGCYNGGHIQINKGCTIKSGSMLEAIDNGRIHIGKNCHVGVNSVISAKSELVIGDGCQIAEMVSIRDHDHRFGGGVDLTESGSKISEVKIGSNVWIGSKVTVTKGVEIGDNCVIGANAVVTEDIPVDSIAVGIPAKVIKTIKG